MILVVEDDPDISQLISEILKMQGYSFFCARNGMEALHLLERNSFDLILMDIHMPVLNGLEATQIIRDRERENGHRTPIIAVTSHSRHECLSVGMDAYLPKPVSFNNLLNTVARYTKPAPIMPVQILFSTIEEKPADRHPEIVDNFAAICQGDRELAQEFLQLLLDDYPIHLTAINQDLGQRDPASLLETLHKLKGSASNLLVPGVDDLVSQLKEKAEKREYGEAERILVKMKSLFTQFVFSVQHPGNVF